MNTQTKNTLNKITDTEINAALNTIKTDTKTQAALVAAELEILFLSVKISSSSKAV
jgi:hypothetical protein